MHGTSTPGSSADCIALGSSEGSIEAPRYDDDDDDE